MDEIHAIRYKNYDETKNLSAEKQLARVRQRAEAVIKKYRLHLKTLEKSRH
jgi:hypothetical protein